MILEAGARVLGRYVLEAEIGRGGFGVVWRAKQLSTGQTVAVKVLTAPQTVDPARRAQEQARFERELGLVARLHHPNVVRLVDSGRVGGADGGGDVGAEGGGEPCMVLEFLRGEPLSVLIERGPLQPKLAVRLMTQTLEALRHAHQHGVIHRDLKPQNIMVTGSERPVAVVLDFGVSAVFGSREGFGDYKSLTAGHQLLGTPSYMAPEQVNQRRDLTPAVDVYAWGLVFLECLTGQPAVASESLMETLMQQISDVPVPIPASVAGSVLGPILQRALAKPLSDRYPDADSPLRDLDAIPGDALEHLTFGTFTRTVARVVTPAGLTLENAETGAFSAPALPPAPEPPIPSPSPSPSTHNAATPSHPQNKNLGPWIAAGFVVVAVAILVGAWLMSPSAPAPSSNAPPAPPPPPSSPSAALTTAPDPQDPPDTHTPPPQSPATSQPATSQPVTSQPATSQPTTPQPHAAPEPPPAPTPPGMVWIPPGVAVLGTSEAGLAAAIEDCKRLLPAHYCDRSYFERELPQHRVRLVTGFFLDTHEATVAAYTACVRDNACTPPHPHPGTCDATEITAHMPDSDRLPINCIDAHQAAAFCAWSKKRLPFEVEWEYAARGPHRRAPLPVGRHPNRMCPRRLRRRRLRPHKTPPRRLTTRRCQPLRGL